MEACHQPGMVRETLRFLGDLRGRTVLDATLGTGAFSRLLIEAGAFVIGLDRDPESLELARATLQDVKDRCRLIQGRWSEMAELLPAEGFAEVHGVVLDAGISMAQMQDLERGFSAYSEAGLDMRMNRRDATALTAYQVVNEYIDKDLRRVFRTVGRGREELRVVARIVRARKCAPIRTTAELADLIAATVSPRRPANRMDAAPYLWAIRAEVNSELTELEAGIEAACQLLSPTSNGTLVVLSWNGAEHRLTKATLSRLASPCICLPALPCVCGRRPTIEILTKKALSPSEQEIRQNPAVRSARLHAARRLPVQEPETPD